MIDKSCELMIFDDKSGKILKNGQVGFLSSKLQLTVDVIIIWNINCINALSMF